jgi:hypothetical protein
MKELFRERDPALVGMYQSLLESAGIATHVRNRDLVVMVTEVPIPEFFPALCVVNDGDYDRALEILRAQRDASGPGERKATVEGVPYETRGIMLSGVALLCFLLFLLGAAGLAVNLGDSGLGGHFRDSDRSPGAVIVSVGIMLAAILIVVRTTRGYLATRKRAAQAELES